MILINIVCVLALAVILWPLLVISKYNYPSADDWSYGQLHVLQEAMTKNYLILFLWC